MKKFFLVLGHLLLLGVFLALVNPFALFFLGAWTGVHTHWFVSQTASGVTHYFVPVGLIAITLLFVLIAAMEALMKRPRAVMWTTVVWVLGVIAALKWGWYTPGG